MGRVSGLTRTGRCLRDHDMSGSGRSGFAFELFQLPGEGAAADDLLGVRLDAAAQLAVGRDDPEPAAPARPLRRLLGDPVVGAAAAGADDARPPISLLDVRRLPVEDD